MSIHAISGKPGGGKSLYAVKMVLEELLHGHRVVITNLALNLGAINEYLQREFPQKNVDVFERIRILNDDETGSFWTFRPKGRDEWIRISKLTPADWSQGRKPSYAEVSDHGVFYAIDECHNFFNARAWAETGRDVLFYLSQHRKLGDTVVWITQAVMNVDKQFRSVTQDYTYLRNLNKEKMGLFKLPAMFLRRTYGEPATPTSQAMETGSFKLDVSGLASLYYTAQGVGIHNRGMADVKERRKGVPWQVVLVGLPVIVLALFLGLPKLGAYMFGAKRHLPVVHSVSVKESSVVSSSDLPLDARQSDIKVPPTNGSALDMVAYCVVPASYNALIRHTTVVLSDGRKFHNGDGHLQYLCEDFCIVDGRTNWYHPPELPVVVSQTPIVAPVALLPSVAAFDSQSFDSDGGVVKYVIPNHVNTLAHPAVRSAMGGLNFNSQSY